MASRQGWRARVNIARWAILLGLLVIIAVFGGRQIDFDQSGRPVPEFVRGAARVVDGDSLVIGWDRIRLKGIDAPEGEQTCKRDGRDWRCGEDARRTLERLIEGATVSCRTRGRDQHGRVLAFCSTPAHGLNAEMVASGFAVAYGDYEAEENAAKSARRGLWAGEFERPRDWRHARGIGER